MRHLTLPRRKIIPFLKQRHRHLLEHNHSQEMSRVQYDRLHTIRHQQNSCDESALPSEMCALDKGMRVLFRGVKWCWVDVWRNSNLAWPSVGRVVDDGLQQIALARDSITLVIVVDVVAFLRCLIEGVVSVTFIDLLEKMKCSKYSSKCGWFY